MMRRIGYWLGREASNVQKSLTINPNSHFQSQAGQICFSTLSPALPIRPQPWQARSWMLQQGGQAWRNMATVRRMAPGGSVNARGIDIGARARRNQNRRLWTYGLSFSCIAGFIIIVLSSFQDSLVFYVTPTDALNKFRSDPSKNKFRLGGLVLEGSVVQPASTTEMEFVVTDLVTDVLVRHKGTVPDLFREGHSVVVEGFLRPISTSSSTENSGTESFRPLSIGHVASEKARSNNCYFSAIDVLAKHDEKYMPKEVAAAIEKNRAAIEAAHAKPQPQLQTSQLQEFEQPDRVMEFCNHNDLQIIVRAHECVMDGFERFAQGHLITLFSATNYCGTANNAGAILVLGRDLVVVPKLIHPLPPAITSPETSPKRHLEDTWMQELNVQWHPTPTRGRPQTANDRGSLAWI